MEKVENKEETKVSSTSLYGSKIISRTKSETKNEKVSIRLKNITVKAARNFVVLPSAVQNETRTRIGAFAKRGETVAFKSLTEEEIKKYGLAIIGTSLTSNTFTETCNEYFNNFNINIPYNEGVKIVTPVDSDGNIILNDKTKDRIIDIMRYRHLINHPRVAKDYSQFEEAPQLYIAYIIDRRIQKQENVIEKNIRKLADKLYLELTEIDKNLFKLNWVLEVARRGVKTESLKDPSTGFIPSELQGVLNIQGLDKDEKDLAIEEFKNRRPLAFTKIVQDKDLEWKALLERFIVLGVLRREGNVVMNEREAVGSNDGEAIAMLKSTSYGEKLVVLKQKLKNTG